MTCTENNQPTTLHAGSYTFEQAGDGSITRTAHDQLDRPALALLSLAALAALGFAVVRLLAGTMNAGGVAIVVGPAVLICGLPIARTLYLRRTGTLAFDAALALLTVERKGAKRDIPFRRIAKITLAYRRGRGGRAPSARALSRLVDGDSGLHGKRRAEIGRFAVAARLDDGEVIHIATLNGPRAWIEPQALAIGSMIAQVTGAPLDVPEEMQADPDTEKRAGPPESDASIVEPLTLGGRTTRTILVTAILLWCTAALLWIEVGFDKWVLIAHTSLRTNDLAVGIGRIVSRYGMPAIILVYLLYLPFSFRFKLRRAHRIYLLVMLMFGIAGPVGDFLQMAIARPRPFAAFAGEIEALPSAATFALPSGHATKSVALALPFLLFVAARDRWHRGTRALIAVLALAVCYSRVLLGVHHVSDVLAGVGTALLSVPAVTLLANTLLGRMNRRVLSRAVLVWAAILVGLAAYIMAY